MGDWLGKIGTCEKRVVTKMNIKEEKKVTEHDVWFPLDASVEVGAAKPSAWCRKLSSAYIEDCALEFILDTNMNRLSPSSVLLRADNKGQYFVLKKGSSSIPSDSVIIWEDVTIKRQLTQPN